MRDATSSTKPTEGRAWVLLALAGALCLALGTFLPMEEVGYQGSTVGSFNLMSFSLLGVLVLLTAGVAGLAVIRHRPALLWLSGPLAVGIVLFTLVITLESLRDSQDGSGLGGGWLLLLPGALLLFLAAAKGAGVGEERSYSGGSDPPHTQAWLMDAPQGPPGSRPAAVADSGQLQLSNQQLLFTRAGENVFALSVRDLRAVRVVQKPWGPLGRGSLLELWVGEQYYVFAFMASPFWDALLSPCERAGIFLAHHAFMHFGGLGMLLGSGVVGRLESEEEDIKHLQEAIRKARRDTDATAEVWRNALVSQKESPSEN